jgi:peptide/nickel transport system substrate-binding protein
VAAYGDGFGRRPVGTGPFRLARWRPTEQALLVRHGRYWRAGDDGARLPYLDGVDIRFRADATEAGLAAAFLKGETHLLAAQPRLLETLGQDEAGRRARFKVAGGQTSLSLRFLGFALDNGSPLARSPELRRAFALAFDRSPLGRSATYSPAPPADSLVPPALLGRSLRWHIHSPERAAELLAPYLKELAARPPVLASNFASDDIALLQKDLRRLSVPASVHVRPAGYYGYIAKERPDVFRVSYTPSFGDPEDYYCLFYSKSSAEVNLTGYRNPEYDRLLEAAMGEMDPARRNELFVRLEGILRDDAPALYLNHGLPVQVAVAPRLHGVTVRLFHSDFAAAWLAPPEAGGDAAQHPQ